MKTGRKLTAAVLAAVLMATSTAVVASAEEDYEVVVVNGLEFRVYDDVAYLNDVVDREMTEFVIPSEVNGKKIYGIGAYSSAKHSELSWLDICPNVETLIIPSTIADINMDAFTRGKALTTVIIGKGIEHIYECAFDDCDNLKDVYYAGSKEEWEKIDIRQSIFGYPTNESLLNATIHYNSTGPNNTPQTPTEAQLAVSDANGDNAINAKDATMVLKMVVGLEPKNGKGDVNGDGKVNAKDATEILKYIVGLPSAIDNIK